MRTANIPCQRAWPARRLGPALAAVALAAGLTFAAAASPRGFDSPEVAAQALVDAVRANRAQALRDILGPQADRLMHSGDPVEDARSRRAFVAAYDEASQIVVHGVQAQQAELQVGHNAWPLPIPLEQADNGRWYFNTAAAAAEILARRMGRNELSAMQACLAIVDAEREYAMRNTNSDGVGEYTQRFRSHPGTHDGLYWPTHGDDPPSPLGPLLAQAARAGYAHPRPGRRVPYQGYFYKILSFQGADAAGGAYDYVVGGKMVGGVAVMAYPARYGASGVMSFMVGQNHVVYEKDLGPGTAAIAHSVRQFNPDATWKETAPDTQSSDQEPAP